MKKLGKDKSSLIFKDFKSLAKLSKFFISINRSNLCFNFFLSSGSIHPDNIVIKGFFSFTPIEKTDKAVCFLNQI